VLWHALRGAQHPPQQKKEARGGERTDPTALIIFQLSRFSCWLSPTSVVSAAGVSLGCCADVASRKDAMTAPDHAPDCPAAGIEPLPAASRFAPAYRMSLMFARANTF
jgi:hypothetical protein